MKDLESARNKINDTIDFYNQKLDKKFKLSVFWETVFSRMMIEFVDEQTCTRPKVVYASCSECCEDIELSGKNLDKQWPVLKCAECGSDLTIHDLEY